jgi:hypothetical protein
MQAEGAATAESAHADIAVAEKRADEKENTEI